MIFVRTISSDSCAKGADSGSRNAIEKRSIVMSRDAAVVAEKLVDRE